MGSILIPYEKGSDNMRFKKNKDIVEHVDNGERFLLNMKNGNFYALHEVSANIWNMLDETDKSYEIISMLSKQYTDVAKETLTDDINCFLKELIKEELVRKI